MTKWLEKTRRKKRFNFRNKKAHNQRPQKIKNKHGTN